MCSKRRGGPKKSVGRSWVRVVMGALWRIISPIPKAATARGFQGQVNEAHRLFVVSFDLVHQGGNVPWVEPGPVPDEITQVLLDFVLSNRDSFDVCLAFDGTLRKSRR